MTDQELAKYEAELESDRRRIAAKHAATNPTDRVLLYEDEAQAIIDTAKRNIAAAAATADPARAGTREGWISKSGN